MQQKLMLKSQRPQATAFQISFNMPDIDGLFPAFKPGDFAVIHGPKSVTSLISGLCTKAQLPKQQGGLESKVVFIDAANSSSLQNFIEAAEHYKLNPNVALGNMTKMRAYTAYSLTSLIMEELEEAIKATESKLVFISDIVGPFLNDNVDDQEAKAVFSQIMSYLTTLAKRHKIVIIASCLPHESSRRSTVLQEITTTKAPIVIRFTKTPYTSEVELEKHPTYMLGVMEFDPEAKPSSNANNGLLCYKIL